MNKKFACEKGLGNIINPGQKFSYVLIFAQFVHVQNMLKFGPFKNFPLYVTCF